MVFFDGSNPGQSCRFQNWNAVQIILFSWAGENPAAVLELTARKDWLIWVHHVHWLCLGAEGMVLSARNPAWNPFPIGVTGGWTTTLIQIAVRGSEVAPSPYQLLGEVLSWFVSSKLSRHSKVGWRSWKDSVISDSFLGMWADSPFPW